MDFSFPKSSSLDHSAI